MPLSNKGQALIEACTTLPITIIILHLLVTLMLATTNFYLADHWVYQSALCLASQESKDVCASKLQKKLALLPLSHFKIEKFLKTSSQSFVSVDFHSLGIISHRFQDDLRLPLKASDFKR